MKRALARWDAVRVAGPVWLLPILALALALRVACFLGLSGHDDVGYRGAAREMAAGEWRPNAMLWMRHGLIIPVAVAETVFGPSEWSAALVPLAYSLGSIVLVYAIGRLAGGPALGLTAGALLAVFPLDVVFASDLHTDLPAGVLMAASMYAVMRGEAGAPRARWWFALGGAMLALAYLTKDIALVLLLVLATRAARAPAPWRQHARSFGAGFVGAVIPEWIVLGWMTGNPFHRHSSVVIGSHVEEMALYATPGWWLDFPGMLLNPLDRYFGVHAGIVYLALAGAAWSLARRHRFGTDVLIWWGIVLLVFNFAPLDPGFRQPLFLHFPRTLHPLVIPFVLSAAVFVVAALRGQPLTRAAALVPVTALAIVGAFTLAADYRVWASPARQAAEIIDRAPADVVIAADVRSQWLLRELLPHRRARIVRLRDLDLTAGGPPALVLRDPLFVRGEAAPGGPVPPGVLGVPPHWVRLAELPRPRRPSIRGTIAAAIGLDDGSARVTPLPGAAAPAVLWAVGDVNARR